MILITCMALMLFGTIVMTLDLFIPFNLPPMMWLTFKMMGMILNMAGLFLLIARIKMTGVDAFIDPVNPKRVILIHQRRGNNPNAQFMKAKLEDLEHISARNKLFKDTGGGFRIAGHDVRRTHETICHDIPEWLGQYFHQIKKKYCVDNKRELNNLYAALRNLGKEKKPKPKIDYSDLDDMLGGAPHD